MDLQPQRRLRRFPLEEGPCLLSYHVRETEFCWLAELDVGERHFEPIAGKTAEEAKKNAAMAAVQALKMEKSTLDPPPPSLSSRPPRHLRGRFEFNECEDEFKLKFLGPEEANIHRIRQRSHAKLKVINKKEKHFLITVFIALMASDFSFALPSLQHFKKWEDQLTQVGFAVVFSNVFGCFGPSLVLP